MPIRKAQGPLAVQAPKVDPQELFGAAVAKKRAGDLDGALELLDQMLEVKPDSVPGRMAKAGYQFLSGDEAGGRAAFEAIEVPPFPPGSDVNPEGFDYFMNAAWFHALAGEDDKAIDAAASVLTQAPADAGRPVLANFFDTEPDLQRLKDDPKVLELLQRTPAASPDPSSTAGDVGTSGAPANAFERDAAAAFVAQQAQSPATSTTQSPLNVRMAAVSSKPKPSISDAAQAELDKMSALVPAPGAGSMGPAEQLGRVVSEAIATARAAGEDLVGLDTQLIDPLLKPIFGSAYKGYDSVVETLEGLGYKANADGFTGVAVFMPDADGDQAAAPDRSQVLADVAGQVSPPGGGDISTGEQLGNLVRGKIEEALQQGETRANLEPSDLDGLLKPLELERGYAALAGELEKAGYNTFVDGFIGVTVSWDAPDADAPSPDEAMKTLQGIVPPYGGGAMGPTERLTTMIQTKMEAALKAGQNRVDLDTDELSPILRPLGAKVDELATALEGSGFKTFADGFIGVSLSWGDD